MLSQNQKSDRYFIPIFYQRLFPIKGYDGDSMFDDEEEAFSDWTESRTMGRNSVQVCSKPLQHFSYQLPSLVGRCFKLTHLWSLGFTQHVAKIGFIICTDGFDTHPFHNPFCLGTDSLRYGSITETRLFTHPISCFSRKLFIFSSMCQPTTSSRAEFKVFFWLFKVFLQG